MTGSAEIFVPGRLCLFGEHSDWAGEYRREDPSLHPGACIVAGTDQGITAEARLEGPGFSISQVLPGGSFSPWERYATAEEAKEAAKRPGNFNAYAAGTASVILRKHPSAGLSLRVHRRTLPLRKGLSSSAAVCVATARGFNMLNRLGMSLRQEMEAAYRGELLTGSHCGRMDQACAWGGGPVLLSFSGDIMETEELTPGGSFHLLIVDLGGKKDTKRILSDLNAAFAAEDPGLRRALGEENLRIVTSARSMLEQGNPRGLGSLMNEAQEIFDALVAPCCPGELGAPILHGVLEKGRGTGLVWGGKGVGSQGDGTAQFLCRGEGEREALRRIMEAETGQKCYYLTM